MNFFWRWFDKLLDILAAMAGIILVFICAAVCYTIGMRYLFNSTTIWIMQKNPQTGPELKKLLTKTK